MPLVELVALRKKQSHGVRSTAITLLYAKSVDGSNVGAGVEGDGFCHELQLSHFTNRNRAFSELLKQLLPTLPHLALALRTPSSALLQSQLGLAPGEVSLRCLPLSNSDLPPTIPFRSALWTPTCLPPQVSLHEWECNLLLGAERSRGTLHLTPRHLCFVSAAAGRQFAVPLTDILRMYAVDDGALEGQLRIHTRAFECLVNLDVSTVDVLETMEGLLPASSLEEVGGTTSAGLPQADSGGGAVDEDLDDEANVGAVLMIMSGHREDACETFHLGLRVMSRPCHGRGRYAAHALQSSIVLVPPLHIENGLPYAISYCLASASSAGASATVLQSSAELAPGATAASTTLPHHARSPVLQLRLRICGEWGPPIAEYINGTHGQAQGSGSWRAVASRCVVRDPYGRIACLTLLRQPLVSRGLLALSVQVKPTTSYWISPFLTMGRNTSIT